MLGIIHFLFFRIFAVQNQENIEKNSDYTIRTAIHNHKLR